MSGRGAAARALRAVLAALILLAALDGAAWLWAVERLRAGFEAWTAQMRESGWTVDGGAPRRAGWPLAAELIVSDPAISGGDALVPGGASWRGTALRLRLSPLAPRTLMLLPEGVQRLRLASLPEASVEASDLAITAPLSGDGAPELHGRALRVSAAGVSSAVATLDAVAIPGGVRAEASLIAMPRGYTWPLGDSVQAASVEATLSGPPLPVPPGTTAAQQAARWRDAGGRLDVPGFALRWGPLQVRGSGTGGLDSALQPRAQASVRLQGWQDALDQLVQGGALSPGGALAARAALGLFARASDNASPGEVAVPVTVADGRVYAGGIPVARIPWIVWP